MIARAVESFSSLFHHSCKQKQVKCERELLDLDKILKQFISENHELKAIFNYRVFELEQEIERLKKISFLSDDQQVDTLIDEDLQEDVQENALEQEQTLNRSASNLANKLLKRKK